MSLEGPKLSPFLMIWQKDNDYSRAPYDLLDNKVLIFFNAYLSAEILPPQFHAAFTHTLTGRAKA